MKTQTPNDNGTISVGETDLMRFDLTGLMPDLYVYVKSRTELAKRLGMDIADDDVLDKIDDKSFLFNECSCYSFDDDKRRAFQTIVIEELMKVPENRRFFEGFVRDSLVLESAESGMQGDDFVVFEQMRGIKTKGAKRIKTILDLLWNEHSTVSRAAWIRGQEKE